MKASVLLKREIIYRWAEEIAKEIEDDSILILKYDIVVNSWIEEINKLLPSIKIKNACNRLTCPKTCPTCVNIIESIKKKDESVCINCKSIKLLYVKIREIRYKPVKIISVDKGLMCFIEEDSEVDIIDANSTKIFLNPKIFHFIKGIDKDYMNPVLIVRMLSYLEYEKAFRSNRNIDGIISGLRISFLYDPVHIETARLNLFRQNKIVK